MEQLREDILVRNGALPVRYWLAAANSTVFEMAHQFDIAAEKNAAQLRQIAHQIGQELVPNVAIGRKDRAFLLNIRRRLHNCKVIRETETIRAVALARDAGAHQLAAEIVSYRERSQEMVNLDETFLRTIEVEIARLLNLSRTIASDSPLARVILAGVGIFPDSERGGRFFKRRMRFFERTWQLITRAATNPTPRGWLSHMGLITADPSAANTGAFPSVDSECSVHWTESVRGRRRAEIEKKDSTWPMATDMFGLNPLHWSEEGEHVSVVLDHHSEPACVVMRETDLLLDILGLLSRGPRTFAQLCDVLGVADEANCADLRTFLQHLSHTGVVEASVIPNSTLTRVNIQDGTPLPHEVNNSSVGWIDVYRRVEPNLAMNTHLALRQRLPQVLRVLQLIDPYCWASDHRSDTLNVWTFADILKTSLVACRADRGKPTAAERSASKIVAGSRSSDVLEYIRAHTGSDVLHVPLDLVVQNSDDTCAAKWPVDCVVRIPESSAPYRFVVSGVWPAGTIDSRFSEGLDQAFGFASRVEQYRSFLGRLEELTGIAFVEILAPPLTEHADNAVRRPAYTSRWTGDPNRNLYLAGSGKSERYVSPHDIVVTLGPGGMESRCGGQRLWPIYHATRSFSPPWDQICHTLLATSFVSVPPSYRRPHALIVPDRKARHVPRIVLDGDIVLCPAQWMIVVGDLWDPRDGLATKIRKLGRARRRLRVPRWIEVSDEQESFTVACDLESIGSIRLIDRTISLHGTLLAREMLPTPEEFLLGDKGHLESDRLTSEMVIRMPAAATLPTLAERLAREIALSAV
jgi:hypothetical protein